MDEPRSPLADVLSGMTVNPLGPGETPIDAFVLIKVLDREGELAWSFRTTSSLNLEELLGAMHVQVEILTRKLADLWD